MIGRRPLPQEYLEWNTRWGAPYGRLRRAGSSYRAQLCRMPRVARSFLDRRWLRLAGPFGLQDNNETRAFEYPWAFLATELSAGMRCVELGGGMSGFQFVLAKSGLEVVNVDPGDPTRPRWGATPAAMDRANKAFGTSVSLVPKLLQDAQLPESHFDRVFSISTLEHVPPDEVGETMRRMASLLKPEGYCILTVDLFLDLSPFTSQTTNRYGSNLNIRELVATSGLELCAGSTAELLGYDEFDPEQILRQLPELFVGWGYPALAQALVLRKR